MAIFRAASPLGNVFKTDSEVPPLEYFAHRRTHLLVGMKFGSNEEFWKTSFALRAPSFKSSRLSYRFSGNPRASMPEDPISDSGDGKPAEKFSIDEQTSYSPESPSFGSQSDQPCVFPDNRKDVFKQKVSNAAENAMKRAAAYKKRNNGSSEISSPDVPEVEIVRCQSIQSRLQSSNCALDGSLDSQNVENSNEVTSAVRQPLDVLRFIEGNLAARSLESVEENAGSSAPSQKFTLQQKSLAAFEKARAYKMQQAEMVAALRGEPDVSEGGLVDRTSSVDSSKDGKVVEVEIFTRDGVIKKKLMNPDEQMRVFSNIKDVKKKGVSAMDFAGLGFADKRKSGRPAGLNDDFVEPPTGVVPEVEILTRDAGSFQSETAEEGQNTQLYKPRVSTWGVFPRPVDISKAYGGGRTIRPGECLETEIERTVREARTRQLLDAYRNKAGLNVDPKIKAESEQIVKRADGLMDSGLLEDAIRLYQLAMMKMPTRSELHGQAALQSGVCLDSLGRYDEAKQVYEKLLGHPIGSISKQARRFLFGFQAMEKLKVGEGYQWDTSSYRKYFDAFADGYNTTYNAEDKTKENLLPYAILLLFPIILVFALAALKG